MSISFSVLLPKNTSGRSPDASRRDFCSPSQRRPAYCQSICTLVVSSSFWNMAFSLRSRMLALHIRKGKGDLFVDNGKLRSH